MRHVDQDVDELYRTGCLSKLRSVVLLTPSLEDAHDVTQEAYSRAV